jgi:hypothetical protein
MANAAARWRQLAATQGIFLIRSRTKQEQSFLSTDLADCHRFSIHLIPEGFIREIR